MTEADWQARAKIIMQIGVSGIVLLAGLAIILIPGTDDTARKWAVGIIGVVVGYWLK